MPTLVWMIGSDETLATALTGTAEISFTSINADKLALAPAQNAVDLVIICAQWKSDIANFLSAINCGTIWLDSKSQTAASTKAFNEFLNTKSVRGGTLEISPMNLLWIPYAITKQNFNGITSWVKPGSNVYSTRLVNVFEIGARVDYLLEKCGVLNLGWYRTLPILCHLSFLAAAAASNKQKIRPTIALYATLLANGQWVILFDIPLQCSSNDIKKVVENMQQDASFEKLMQTSDCVSVRFCKKTDHENIDRLELTAIFQPQRPIGLDSGDRNCFLVQSVEVDPKQALQQTFQNAGQYQFITFPEAKNSSSTEGASTILKQAVTSLLVNTESKIDTETADQSVFKNDEMFIKFLKSPSSLADPKTTRIQKLIAEIQQLNDAESRMTIAELIMRYLDLFERHKNIIVKSVDPSKLKKLKKAA